MKVPSRDSDWSLVGWGYSSKTFLSILLDFLRAEKGNFGLALSFRHEDYESSINTIVGDVKITKNSIYVREDNTDLLLSIKRLSE
jgi:hypothetical protein